MSKKLKFNQPTRLPLPNDFVSDIRLNMKEVRIDPKTLIEVPDSVSDKQAREEHFKKREHSDNSIGPMVKNPEMYKKKVKHERIPQPEVIRIGDSVKREKLVIRRKKYHVKIKMDRTICMEVEARNSMEARNIAWDKFKNNLPRYRFKVKGGTPLKQK